MEIHTILHLLNLSLNTYQTNQLIQLGVRIINATKSL